MSSDPMVPSPVAAPADTGTVTGIGVLSGPNAGEHYTIPLDIEKEQQRYQDQLESIETQLRLAVERRMNLNATIAGLREQKEWFQRLLNATKPRTRKPRASTAKPGP